MCEHIIPFRPRTKFSLLMHPMEAKRQRLGTGRLMRAAIESSELFYDVNMDEDKDFQNFIQDPQYHHVLLYPSDNPDYIDSDSLPPNWETPLLKQDKTLVLHFLDATWPMAKKMMRLSKCLQAMPKVSFKNTYQSRFVIKHQPHKAALSTIETAYYCLEGLKKMGWEKDLDNKHNNLITLLEELVSFQLKCEYDPNIKSSRGTKPLSNPDKKTVQRHKPKQLNDYSRIREKKNRLFYWDVDRSPTGRKND